MQIFRLEIPEVQLKRVNCYFGRVYVRGVAKMCYYLKQYLIAATVNFSLSLITRRSISPEANGEKDISFQKLFLFINIIPLKSDTISPTSF